MNKLKHYYSYIFHGLVLNFLSGPIFHSKSYFASYPVSFWQNYLVACVWLPSKSDQSYYPPSGIFHCLGMPFILQLLEPMFGWTISKFSMISDTVLCGLLESLPLPGLGSVNTSDLPTSCYVSAPFCILQVPCLTNYTKRSPDYLPW